MKNWHIHRHTLWLKMFAQGGYVPDGGNEKGRVATPTSILIFDYNDMKSL